MESGGGDLQVLSRREVAAILGISLVTLWRMVDWGAFPRPFRISPGRVGWCAGTVKNWIARRAEASPGEAATGEGTPRRNTRVRKGGVHARRIHRKGQGE